MSRLLLDALQAPRLKNVFNPWRDRDPTDLWPDAPQQRWLRLLDHFNRNPRYILIGEAPGYQGCHFSGIPFTSERLLMEGAIPGVTMRNRITSRPEPWSEPSATIMWGSLAALGLDTQVIMWNAFPWHPHHPGEPHTNRTPTPGEISAGEEILRLVIRQHGSGKVVAVGRVAERALRAIKEEPAVVLRHPSNGGANLFREGIRNLLT